MSFHMALSRPVFDHLNAGIPDVQGAGGNAHPAVDHYNLDAEGLTGAFTVLYRCAAGTPGAATTVSLAFGLSPTVVVQLRWVKRCGGGPNSLVDLRYADDDGEEVAFGAAGADAAAGAANVTTIGPMESATRVLVHLRAPAQTLDYAAPSVTSSDSAGLGVELRGAPVVRAGTLSADAPAELRVLYTCHRPGESTVTLRLRIPPWDDVTAAWHKDCGGGAPPGLDVRLVAGGGVPADVPVMVGGTVLPTWAVDENTSTPASGAPSAYHTLPADVAEASFALTNNGGHLHVAGVVLTVADPHVLRAAVETPAARGPGGFLGYGGPPWLGPAGAVLERGDAARLRRAPRVRAGGGRDGARDAPVHGVCARGVGVCQGVCGARAPRGAGGGGCGRRGGSPRRWAWRWRWGGGGGGCARRAGAAANAVRGGAGGGDVLS
eukprot:TRINITY_DN7912_c0_g1_i1.p1 TRINITY_DN7912_c0_g1~~TRINITY_DN7912_c0_g1_i1.p1  ORF type:complete len:435 (+),score=132.23 TRINITY_DN7912_c0_g1_i1:358-1662(+)